MTETSWDTNETIIIIINDNDLCDQAMELSMRSCSTAGFAMMLEDEFLELIDALPYSDIDFGNVDWEEIAAELMED